MNKLIIIFCAALFIFFGTGSWAQMSEEAKIAQLIRTVREIPPGAKFIRNGKEHSSDEAADHLSAKYKRGKKYAMTAKFFIENIASKSSVTGIEYRIKFADGKIVATREFFTEELRKIEEK